MVSYDDSTMYFHSERLLYTIYEHSNNYVIIIHYRSIEMEMYQRVVIKDVLRIVNIVARGDMKTFSSYVFGEPKDISRFDIDAKSHLCVIVAYIVQYSEDEAIQELSDVVYSSLINYARNEGLDLSYEPVPINYLPYEEREELINSIRYIKYLYEGTAVVDSLAMAD